MEDGEEEMKKRSWRRIDGENKIRIEKGRWRWKKESVEKLEWKIRIEKGRWRLRRVSGEIRMGDKYGEWKMKMKKS